MFLSEVLKRYTDQSLADENDLRLVNAQTTVGDLCRAMKRCGELQFTLTNSTDSITIDQLTTVEKFITTTLNARYGCND